MRILEMAVGSALGPAEQGERTDLLSQEKVTVPKNDRYRFRKMYEHRSVWESKLERVAIGSSQRSTARVLGVDKETVARDLGKRETGANAPLEPQEAAPQQDEANAGGANAPPPPPFDTTADGGAKAAQTAKVKAKRAEREKERESRRQENAQKVARQIEAAQVAESVSPVGDIPRNERRVRQESEEPRVRIPTGTAPSLPYQATGTKLEPVDTRPTLAGAWVS